MRFISVRLPTLARAVVRPPAGGNENGPRRRRGPSKGHVTSSTARPAGRSARRVARGPRAATGRVARGPPTAARWVAAPTAGEARHPAPAAGVAGHPAARVAARGPAARRLDLQVVQLQLAGRRLLLGHE